MDYVRSPSLCPTLGSGSETRSAFFVRASGGEFRSDESMSEGLMRLQGDGFRVE